ncbi:MAG: phosphate ABC transporter permease PstA [Sphingomonadaceae bacterium]|uniref:phosphate ABC transporter permease PstA n=1 Tax=Thermaurantiacus sp. TaxID=2820283 RepID=UPI00298ED89E|nr:phosphate ABC transporter permease PstA [Thermaurantiacus sp.]MCS6986864.1 phosphate ABC transporter permease PstA [Sphingomonadaceae bacterium]MDW8415536.1 phosphate ABC transporter permease PstA [Thermaurantiacus sp.]
MTAVAAASRQPTDWGHPRLAQRLRRRHRSERLFRAIGLSALVVAVGFLALLLGTMLKDGVSGFVQTQARIDTTLDPATLELSADRSPEALASANYLAVYLRDVRESLGQDGVRIASINGWTELRRRVLEDPGLVGQRLTLWVPVRSEVDQYAKGRIDVGADPTLAPIRPEQVRAYARLEAEGRIRKAFNRTFLSAADSTSPESAGIRGAFVGSLLTILVTLALAFPVGVLAAIYLEEFAPKNRWTDLIEVSINNLAAVPSIIFGLLGLAVFLNTMGLPRSAPLVGGMTLALMTLPVIVIAARAAIKAVPPSIREAALGIGASRLQTVFQHVAPLALPGILTGTIIGVARALGETAPLLMVGMRAFIVDAPRGFTDPATVLPVQIFLWSDDVNRGFVEKTSAAILVLLAFLLAINAVAVYLRNRYERKW